MKKHGLVYSMVVLLAWLLPACTADDDLAPAVKPAEGLTISLETPGVLSRATTELGSNDLNENTISQAQLLIFNSDGKRTADGYRSFEFTDGKAEAVIATGDWKNAELFDNGADATYDIYVVANAHEGSTSLQNVSTLDDLLSAVDKDADIWKLEGANIGNGTVYTNKRFAMSGVSSGFVPNAVEDEYTISVPMERLAAKVEVNITFSDEFKAKFTPTGFNSSLRNYATRSLLRADKEASFTDRGIAGNRADDPMVAAPEKDIDKRPAKLVLYTYPTNWGGDVLQETFVLLNMPGYYKEQEGAQSESEYKGSNYYKIPVRLGDAAAHQLNRNTIYRVNVTIDRMGQPQLDVPVELKPTYEVIPWTEVTIDVDNGDLNYLEVVKDEIIMKNIEKSEEQYFTSSSSVTASIDEVYYYDKYGTKQTISNYGQYGISVEPAAGNFGNVTINSDVPTNNGIRYIKVTVTNEQGLSKEFTVKQYPLEYIVTVPGWYSYRTDFDSNYEHEGYNRKVSNNYFSSKVYYEGDRWNDEGIYTYTWPRYNTSNNPSLGTRQDGNDNNNMYFVRITKTSDKYVLSVPAMDEDGYTESSPENNKLVAPAFMIASQLGTVYPQRFNDAKEHCKQYAEKSLDGQVYEDWRLPTEAELLIIDYYQGDDNSVIDRVLAGDKYWAASGDVMATNEEEDWWGNVTWENGEIKKADYNENHYIRCIRTVQANEPIVEDKE